MLSRLLSLLTGTWERGTCPGSVGVCPWCPCLSCGPWFFWLWEQGQQDPASLLFVAPVLSAPGGSWCPSRRCRAASACLSLSLSLHPKGFPTTSQKCLIGHRICPVLFCLAVLAWQAGELGVPVLDVAGGTGRVAAPLGNLKET